MDLIKTSLIVAIAITLYYLLLQWPNEPISVVNEPEEINKLSTLNDSKDSLTKNKTNSISIEEPRVTGSVSRVDVGQIYEVGNRDLLLEVEAKSGQIIGSKLINFKKSMGAEESLEILGDVAGNAYLANSGFTTSQGYMEPDFNNKEIRNNADGSVVFYFNGESDGFYHERKMTFQESGFSVVVEDKVISRLDSELTVAPYGVIERNGINETEGGFLNPENFAYLGPVFSTQDDVYEKYSFSDINDSRFDKTSIGGWVALIQHYFLTAWVPDQNSSNDYMGMWGDDSGRFIIGYRGPTIVLGPGEAATTTNTLYVGPKYPADLSEIEENLDLTVDYGFLFWLGKPMYWVLEQGNSIFKSWGMAIIFLTVVIKLITWPLSAKAYVSMGKMRALQPKLAALQEKHGDNKQKMSQEMMEFYKKEGVNPLGGCLPMLLQMPFFLAFYWVLLETVELRHSGFLWLEDLSAMDPYFILPILNGLGMYLSQKMTPTPPNADPMQAQMMKFFPVVFAVIFAWFPAGLVLYWLMNMLIQIIQQWWYSRSAATN